MSSVNFSRIKSISKLLFGNHEEVISLFATFFTEKILEVKESTKFSNAYIGIFGEEKAFKNFVVTKRYTEDHKSRVNCNLVCNGSNVSLFGGVVFTRSQINGAALSLCITNIYGARSFQCRGLVTATGRSLTFPSNFYKLAHPHIDKSLLAEDNADQLSELVQTLKNLGIL